MDSKRTDAMELAMVGGVFLALIATGIALLRSSTLRERLGPNATVVMLVVVCATGVFMLYAIATDKKVSPIVPPEPICTVSEIPTVFARLEKEGKEGGFATFIVQPPDQPLPDDAINIQFSIEGGRMGLDWYFTDARSNRRDKEKFEQLVSSLGYEVQAREIDDMKYLRIEGAELPQLCQSLICEMYGKNPETKLEMVVDGFSWP